MFGRKLTLGLAALVSVALAGEMLFAADIPQPNDEGIDVQARGPLHEAFAEPVIGQPRPAPIIPKEPPPAIDEVPPDQKPDGDNVQWISGYWAYDDDAHDFLWISGLWRDVPPGRQWVPGYYAKAGDGWRRVPGFWGEVAQQEVQFLPQPPANIDAGPTAPAPADDYVYNPGTWIWRDTRYAWRPGFWLRPLVGWVWCPAHYSWSPSGWVFVEGHWDYPLARRGLLFAPVRFTAGIWGRPGWFYRPQYVVSEPFLTGALFVRPDHGAYYFGDWFSPTYVRLGYTPWVDYRIGRFSHDPLWNWTRWQHRGDRNWDRDVVALYEGRRTGNIALPPRTLVQQNTVIKNTNINNINTNNVTNIHNATALAPLAKMDPKVFHLHTVNEAAIAQERKTIQTFREAAQQRQKTELGLAAKGPVTEPRVAKIEMPKTTNIVKETTVKPPPVPTLPKHDPKIEAKIEPTKPLIVRQPPTIIKPNEGKPLDPKVTTPPTVFKPNEGKPVDPKVTTPPTIVKPNEVKPVVPPVVKPNELKPADPKITAPVTKPVDPKVTAPVKPPEVKPMPPAPKPPENKPAPPPPNKGPDPKTPNKDKDGK